MRPSEGAHAWWTREQTSQRARRSTRAIGAVRICVWTLWSVYDSNVTQRVPVSQSVLAVELGLYDPSARTIVAEGQRCVCIPTSAVDRYGSQRTRIFDRQCARR